MTANRKTQNFPNIFLTGLTSSGLWGMETHNLGNYLILEPLLENLRNEFPNAVIHTSLQLSDKTCGRFGITSLKHPRFWGYGKKPIALSLLDWLKFFIYKIFGGHPKSLVENSLLLKEISCADLVLDFGGDLYGDNSKTLRFLEGSSRMLMAKAMGKPVVHFASSPGPFTRSFTHRKLGPFVLNHVNLITAREPISAQLLIKDGINQNRIVNTACPSFLFSSKPRLDPKTILGEEGLDPDKAMIGIILCGWNMPTAPYLKVPRELDDLKPFLPMLTTLLKETDAQILMMSHSHRTDKEGNLIPGADAIIMKQLFDLLGPENYPNRLFILKGLYDATDMRGILGQLSLLISGRLHGAVSGMTNCVPTVIVDYGHEPKAHKLRGLAQLMKIPEYLVSPDSPEEMSSIALSAWKNRIELRRHLETRLPEVADLARLNFTLLHDFLPKKVE